MLARYLGLFVVLLMTVGHAATAWSLCVGPLLDCSQCAAFSQCTGNCEDDTGSCGVTTCADFRGPVECPPTCTNDCSSNCSAAGDTCATACEDSGASCAASTCGQATSQAGACAANDGWYNVGATFTCTRNGDEVCTLCQYQDYRKHSCSGTGCTFVPVSTQIVYSGCTVCDDGNPCTTNQTNMAGTGCEFPNNSFSQPCYSGPGGTEGVGICASGTETCSGGAFGACVGEVTPFVEACDGFQDENCDGAVDEGCACTDGDTQPCYSGPGITQGVGQCQDGTQTCSGGMWGGCVGEVLPTAETCNTLDDDCDGANDAYLEACYTGPVGTDGVGECVAGQRQCSGGAWLGCMLEVTPVPEICGDGLDNDCDGVVDNGCPMCGPELCNSIDDDCDGVIDEADASNDCAMGEVCAFGTCFVDCSMTMTCGGMDTCLSDDFRCDDATDPCGSITCTAGYLCYEGSCFPDCSMADICDPFNETCYQSGRCVTDNDPCRDVQCPVDQICYGGSCFDPCSATEPCTAPFVCWDGRCAVDVCDGIDCPSTQECVGGSCFESCSLDSQCDPEVCAGTQVAGDERCTTDPCYNIDCPLDQVCHNGSCFDSCTASSMCSGDPCWDKPTAGDFCAGDPCAGQQCGTDQLCFEGTCFDTCMDDIDCDPDSVCYSGRCADKDEPKCDGVLCEVGQVCFQGDCFEDCSSTDPCADPSSICYQGACVPDSCPAGCDPGEVCHSGVCFVDCSTTGVCEDPLECYDGRCAASMCEAIDPPELAAYNMGHPFREKGKRIRIYQRSTPWTYWRPFDSGGDYESFMAMSGVSSTNPLHEAGRAKAVLHLDGNDYVLWLTHGATAGQGAAEVSYTAIVSGENPDIIRTDDDGLEAFKETDSNPRHLQALVTTTANETGGIVIGELPADENWTIKLFASLHGDLEGWDLVNGETGESVPIRQGEPLIIKSENMPTTAPLSPKIGGACESGDDGICAAGTYVDCVLYESVCAQTVLPQPVEYCDGVDNTCNGDVDAADSDLNVPMIFGKQGILSGYQTWPTYDGAASVTDLLTYTPDGSGDLIGSTAVTLPGGTPIQTDHFQSHVFPYRDLRDGSIKFVFSIGKAGTDHTLFSDDEEGDHTIEFDFDAPYGLGNTLEQLKIAWYEDRKPGSTSDRVPQDYEPSDDSYDVEFEIEEDRSGAGTESDTAVMGLDWFGELTGFNVYYDYQSGDQDENPFEWLAWVPTVGTVSLYHSARLRVRVAPRPIDESVCAASGATMSGCGLSKYACVAGQLECQSPDDAACSTCIDADGDGVPGNDPATCPTGTDCNDDDPTVYPGADEICDGLDNNCDGAADLTNVGCPDGAPCGPLECNYRLTCVCPDGPEVPEEPTNECYCGAGLEEP